MSDQESFTSNFIELRQRLIRAVPAVLALIVVLLVWPGAAQIYDLLALPLMRSLPEGTKMIATGVITPFSVPLKVTALAAFVLALPWVIYLLSDFITSGWYENYNTLPTPIDVVNQLL